MEQEVILRAKFQKTGMARFVGHLDIMRYFQKLCRRAGLPLSYTGGFSPHPKMAFGSPLSVGLFSDAEYVDIAVSGEVTEKSLKPLGSRALIEKMNAVSTEDVRILSLVILPEKAENAMSLLAAADYTVEVHPKYLSEMGFSSPDEFYDAFFHFYDRESVFVTKETKKNTVTVDVKTQIRLMKKEKALFLRLDAGSKSNLKPEFLISVFLKESGEEYKAHRFFITRTELYGEEDGTLRKLSDYGEEF